MMDDAIETPGGDWGDDDWSLAKKFARERHDGSASARRARHKRLASAVDGRSLRASGRTEQFNFKCTPGLKKLAQDAAVRDGITLAEWMERAVEAAIRGASDA